VDDHYCLTDVDLFRDLSRREIAAMSARTALRTVRVGQIIYHPAQPTVVLIIVKRGRVRLYRTLPDGRTVTVALAGPGAIFGEMDLLAMRMRDSWAEVLEPGELCLMSRSDVQELLLTDPRIATRVTEHLSVRVAELEDRLTDLVGKTVAERVAHTLRTLSRDDGPGRSSPAQVRLTHHQLAALVGATRERTTAAVGELAAHGLIQPRRGKILIRDPARLATYADGTHDVVNRPTEGMPPNAERSGHTPNPIKPAETG
jgi:CRP/FNR family cyclic AMP-dependent transcriptional regulator